MPYVVVIQSDLLDALATRMTIPLAVLNDHIKVPTALCPIVTVKGTAITRLPIMRHRCQQKP
uniref:CcdB family protein n=1 Tax=Orrella sp. TaxID=1921583 RepID=UPI004047BDE0